MITPLFGLMLLLQGTPARPAEPVGQAWRLKEAVQHFPQSQLESNVAGPISIDLPENSRAAYEALAGLAGFNIIFDPDYRSASIAPLHIAGADIFEAFDRVSASTRSFVEVLDKKTILVAPDNQTKRRDYEIQVLKTIYLTYAKSSPDISAVAAMVRATLQIRFLAVNSDSKSITVRDTPAAVAAAEKLIGEIDRPSSSEPIAFDRMGNLFIPEGASAKKSSPARSRLQVANTPPVAIDMKGESREIFESLAGMAGLNIIFDADFRSISRELKLENVNVLDALDYFGFETRAFWAPVDGTTIMVAPDNATKRRDYSGLLFQSIHFDQPTPQELTEIVTALRTLLNVRYLTQMTTAGSIGFMETPSQIALCKKIIADVTKNRSQAAAGRDTAVAVGNETGGVLRTRAVRNDRAAGTSLKIKTDGRISVDMNLTAHDTFERLAGMAGLQVLFDPRFRDSPEHPFAIKSAGILDALDFLSLQTRNFWEVLDGSTILVAPDNQSVRLDVQPRTEDVIKLPDTPSATKVVEVVTALRTLLNLRDLDGSEKGIAVRDTADNVTLAEKITAGLQ